MAVRAKGKGGRKVGEFLRTFAGKDTSRPLPAGRSAPKPTSAANATREARPLRERPTAGQTATVTTINNKKSEGAADAQLTKKNAELSAKVTELEENVIDIEKERDFYFQKLRDIEVMLQVHQEKGEESDPDVLVENIFKLLYATAEENIIVNDDGEVSLGWSNWCSTLE